MSNYRKVLNSIVIAILITSGFAIVASAVGLWILSVVFSQRFHPPSERLVFKNDGTPVVQISAWNPAGYFDTNEYRDLEGNKIATSGHLEDIMGKHFYWYPPPPQTILDAFWTPSWSSRVICFSTHISPPENWFLIVDVQNEGEGYLVGYDVRTRTRIEFIGKKGFATEKVPSPDRFHFDPRASRFYNTRVVSPQFSYGDGNYPNSQQSSNHKDGFPTWALLLNAEDGLYRVDLGIRKVQTLQRDSEEPYIMMTFSHKYFGVGTRPIFQYALRTADHIQFLDRDGEQTKRYMLPDELREKSLVLYETIDGSVFATEEIREVNGQWMTTATLVHRFDEEGNVASTEELLKKKIPAQGFDRGMGFLMVIPPLVADGMMFLVIPVGMILTGEAEGYFHVYTKMYEEMNKVPMMAAFFILCWVILHIVGALFAWLTYKRQTRYAVSPQQRKLWTIFVFLFGIPGYVGYLTHRKWPVMEECPSCSKAAPQDRDACARCGEEFPEPAKVGTEVFA